MRGSRGHINVQDGIMLLEQSRLTHARWIALNPDAPERPYHEHLLKKYDELITMAEAWPKWMPLHPAVEGLALTEVRCMQALAGSIDMIVELYPDDY